MKHILIAYFEREHSTGGIEYPKGSNDLHIRLVFRAEDQAKIVQTYPRSLNLGLPVVELRGNVAVEAESGTTTGK